MGGLFGGKSSGPSGPGPEYYAQVAENQRIQAANTAAMQALQKQWADDASASQKASAAAAEQTAKNEAARLEAERQAQIQSQNVMIGQSQQAANQSAGSTLAGMNMTQQAADAAAKQLQQTSSATTAIPAADSKTTPVSSNIGLYGGAAKPAVLGGTAADGSQAGLTNQFSLPAAQGLKFGGA